MSPQALIELLERRLSEHSPHPFSKKTSTVLRGKGQTHIMDSVKDNFAEQRFCLQMSLIWRLQRTGLARDALAVAAATRARTSERDLATMPISPVVEKAPGVCIYSVVRIQASPTSRQLDATWLCEEPARRAP